MEFLSQYKEDRNIKMHLVIYNCNVIIYLLIFLYMYWTALHTQGDYFRKHFYMMINVFIHFEILISIVLIMLNYEKHYFNIRVLNIAGVTISFLLALISLNKHIIPIIITYVEGFFIVSIIQHYTVKVKKYLNEIELQKKSISEQNLRLIEKEQRLKYMAYFDTLTGTLNRNAFIDTLDAEIAPSKDKEREFYVAFLDIDDFKAINDTMGHCVGDIVLKEFAKRIMQHLHEEDVIGRLGGDEFAILIIRKITHEKLVKYIENIRLELNKPFTIEEQEYKISASFGVSIYPEDGVNSIDLLKKADIAMYSSKIKGKNQVAFLE